MEGAVIGVNDDYALYWLLYKQQLRLSVALLQQQQNPEPASSNQNRLFSPYSLVSALIALMPGEATASRLVITRAALNREAKSKFDANQLANGQCMVRRFLPKLHPDAILTATVHRYEHPTRGRPIDAARAEKLRKKYRVASVRQLHFENGDQKPNLASLAQINSDLGSDSLMSGSDLAQLIASCRQQLNTLLTSRLSVRTIWSKPWDSVQYGEFCRFTGERTKVEFLVKHKSYHYFEQAGTVKAIKVNCSPGGEARGLAMIFLLPENPGVSLDSYIRSSLSYESLKSIVKQLTARSSRQNVRLTLPSFQLAATHQEVRSIQKLRKMLQIEPLDPKNPDAEPVLDNHLALVQSLQLDVGAQSDPKAAKSKGGSSSSSSSVKDFTADRPFLFLLVSNGTQPQVLLMCVCEDPTSSSSTATAFGLGDKLYPSL